MASKKEKEDAAFVASLTAVQTVSQLEDLALCFLNFAEALGRPMRDEELKPWKFVSEAFYLPSFKAEMRDMPAKRQEKLQELLADLEAILFPEDAQGAQRKPKDEDDEGALFAPETAEIEEETPTQGR